MSSRASRRTIVAVAATALVLIAGVVTIRSLMSRFVQQRLVVQVERQFDSTLEARTFRVSVYPGIRVTGSDLRLRKQGRRDIPPLISIGTFTVTGSFWGLLQGRVRRVDVTNLEIRIPSDADQTDREASAAQKSISREPDDPSRDKVRDLIVDEIISTEARLEIAPNDPEGTPLVFDIARVRLQGFSLKGPATYEARLTNPKPRGEIISAGQFGPWQPEQPRSTPVSGDYTLARADMSVFNGLAGTLDSTGHFAGVLGAISVSGQTTMPDFEVETGGHPMPLHATFDARVDGTNGNTYLDRVSARLGGSSLEATGEIAGMPGADGKTIRLAVTASAARLEDLVFLVVGQDESPMLGQIDLDTRLELPPGEAPATDKLRLDGRFAIRRGRFASDSIQDRVDELSRRGRGEPENASINDVTSDFDGRFALRNGQLWLPNLRFGVPGASGRLVGRYTLRGEGLDFKGELRLQARLSQTMTGFKSILLTVIDPFFRRHGAGAVLPIEIRGTVSNPELRLDLFR